MWENGQAIWRQAGLQPTLPGKFFMKTSSAPIVREGWHGPGRQDGWIEPLKQEDDGLHVDPHRRGVYEWWYFDAHLDSGHTVVVFFHASNPNPGLQGKTGIEFVLLDPDGHRTQKFFSHPKSDFSAAVDRPEVRLGKSFIKVDQPAGRLPVYEIYVDEPNLGCHLTYTAEVNGWKPGTGYSHFGDTDYFAWVVPVPRASVSGTISVGQKTWQVSGIGYHDHNWLNFQFPRIINYWMWGRVYSESYTLAYAYIQCNDKVYNHTVKALMLADGSEIVLSSGEFEFDHQAFEYDARAKHHFPRSIRMSAPAQFKVSLQVSRVLEAQDLLDNYNPLLRFLARYLLRMEPGYFRLASEFELTVELAGQARTETGTTLHEIVIFSPILEPMAERQ
jgi:hypothetical protein